MASKPYPALLNKRINVYTFNIRYVATNYEAHVSTSITISNVSELSHGIGNGPSTAAA